MALLAASGAPDAKAQATTFITNVGLASTTPVAVAGPIVRITLDEALTDRDTVTVSYTVATGSDANPVQDADGNEVAPLTDEPVDNRSDDTSPPILDQATVAGTLLKLVYDEDLDPDSVPGGTALTVEVTPAGESKETRALADTTPVAIDGATVRVG